MSADGEPPVVVLPERLDRKLRLGPFPSGRDALKFASYAAVGAFLVPFAGALAWLPFLLAGGVVALWHPDGEAADERMLRFVRWKLRRLGRGEAMTVPGAGTGAHRALARVPGGFVAVVRTGGVPLAYLPPRELAERFEAFRELLRAFDGSFLWLAARAPIHAVPFLPAEPAPVGAEAPARAGYRELVEVIVRRRHLRQVYFALASEGSGSEGIQRLEAQLGTLLERLRSLGVRPVRLRDRALTEAVRRLGIAPGEPPA